MPGGLDGAEMMAFVFLEFSIAESRKLVSLALLHDLSQFVYGINAGGTPKKKSLFFAHWRVEARAYELVYLFL